MAKAASISSFLFLAAFMLVGISWVRCQTCQVGLGSCSFSHIDECVKTCKSQHGTDAQGSCETTTNPPICQCYYPCPRRPPTPLEFCTDGQGTCSAGCMDDYCNQKCVAALGGGCGMCNTIGSIRLC